MGIIGVFQSIVDLMRSGYGFGIDTAAIRDVAAVNSDENENKLSTTVSLFNKLFSLSALIGLIGCVILCYPISIWAFGDSKYSIHIALLSICAFFTILSIGRSSILQGMRRIGDMAKSSIIGSAISLVITIPLYYFWGLDGIIPYFILIGIATFASANFFYKRLKINTIYIPYAEIYKAGKKILRFGFYIVIAGLAGTLSMLAIRGIIIRQIDMDAAGLFQSAWTITTIYLALLLRSMGSDFFPRLSSIINDKAQVKKLVNEQSYISLLVASPLIVGMIAFSDLFISLFFSSEFSEAIHVLRWQLVGTFLKVLSWPIAFIILAKNKGFLFLVTEVIFYAIYVLSCHFMINTYGLDITGIGYLIAYLVYLPTVYIIGQSISGFKWNKGVVSMLAINLVLIIATFCTSMYYQKHEILIGACLFVVTSIYAFVRLKKVFNLDDLRKWFQKE